MGVLHRILDGAAAKLRGCPAARYLYLKAALLKPVRKSSDTLLWGNPELAAGRPKVAFICDEITWQDFSGCCAPIFLHPNCWKRQLQTFRPDILFCESAWSGIDAYPSVWRGRIYRDRRMRFENRDVLLDILDFCRENRIRTVFWNKEDPAFFGHEIYDYTDTALRFDVLFTTAAECVPQYRALGCKNIHVLPFGVNLEQYYPGPVKTEDHSAVFAGSWYGDMPQRCRETCKLLDYALAQGWALTIYDRKSEMPEARFRFPEKYHPYIQAAKPYSQIPELIRQHRYAINVNTVMDSHTMMSRRVLQLAACGVTIVSNDAQAFSNYEDCLKIRRGPEGWPVYAEGIPEALIAHSTQARFQFVLETATEAQYV